MRLFYEIARRSFQRHLSYRAATIAGLVTNIFFGLLRVAILLALIGTREQVEGYTVSGLIVYTALTQAMISFLSLFGWTDLMESIYTGEVAADLLKPMGFFTFWLAKDLGRAVLNFLLRGVTILAFYGLFFDLVYPETAVQWFTLFLTLVFSWLLSFSWRFLINLTAFWSPNARGIIRFGSLMPWFFSGFLMPLRFFPDWVTRIAYMTPFPHMLTTTVDVYLGVLSQSELVAALLIQAAWVFVLIGAGQVVLKTAVSRLVILGG